VNRRKFLAGSAAAGAMLSKAPSVKAAAGDSPAILGGTPVRRDPFPSWPITDEQEEKAIVSVLRSGKWNRGAGGVVSRFEESYSKLMCSQRCLATANGTSALLVTLNTMGIGSGRRSNRAPVHFRSHH
jgi:perosamine synthetase